MKISYLGLSTFKFVGDKAVVITDPLALVDSGLSMSKTQADICIISQKDHYGKVSVLQGRDFKKLEPKDRDEIFEVINPGEYEVGEVMIRRDLEEDFFVIDEGYLRVVYMGMIGPDFDLANSKDLGDVDVLIVPVGDGGVFPKIDKVQKIIANVDPLFLLPCGYQQDGLNEEYKDLKKVEEFLKEAGYGKIEEQKSLKLDNVPEKDERNIHPVILKC